MRAQGCFSSQASFHFRMKRLFLFPEFSSLSFSSPSQPSGPPTKEEVQGLKSSAHTWL